MYNYGIARRLVLNIPVQYGEKIVSKDDSFYKGIVDHLPKHEEQYCRFEQDRMDFNPYVEFHNTWKNILNFTKVPIDCKDYVKHFALNKLDSGENKPTTLRHTIDSLAKILTTSERLSRAGSFFDITTDIYIQAMEDELWPTSFKSLSQGYHALVDFLFFVQTEMGVYIPVSQERLEWRKETISDLLRGMDGEAHYPVIPEEMLSAMIEGFKDVLDDESQSVSDRMMAGAMLLETQIGTRISEIPCIETNCLHSITNFDGKVDNYIIYNAIKQASAEQKVVPVKTICTEVAKYAIEKLLEVRQLFPAIEKNRFLMVRNTPDCRKGRVVPLGWLNAAYKAFCAKHLRDIVSKDWKGIKKVKVGNDRYRIPSIHSFRVTFATFLFRNGVDADYIDCILGHNPNTDCLDPYISVETSSSRKFEVENSFIHKRKNRNG